ncbi:TonB-dependent receptor [Mucilaginibacter sp. L3T2-6]|uniref:TonB-dependent receptor n=1 Tax=Mucilaginibacter sp. L3T2-6 TaxID=3062491 RepID=UPI002676E38B|nr:TonB-dependent receptor [Mucilaginibacter sp. L3T2-6]MDO3644807.1 TonB-dependent receptor [Mucilaginibacter sp. L3T2-6]MDV6217299.1 TonB-dependent receptor [Mucilaginibacter sp. L3T2-6]
MKLKYIYTLLTLITALYFVPADAQTKHKARAKKPAAKTTAKHAAKKTAPKVTKATAPSQKNAANLGDLVSKAAADTTKKGGKGNDAVNGNLSEEIVVTTAYKPVLADAVKIRRNPDLEDKTPFKAPLTYVPIDKRLELNTSIKRLDAMKMPAEQDSVPTNNYVKAGLGSLKTTYGEAYFANGKDNALQVGGYLKHFAQNGNLYNQKSAKEEVGVFGKSVGDLNSLSGRITYNYNSNYFYGFDEFTAPSAIQANKQHFSTLGAEGELAKNYQDVEKDFTYALKLKGYIFSDAYQARENNLVLSGFVNQTIKQFYAGLAGSIDLSTQKDSLFDYNNSLIRLNPYIKFQGDNYKVDAGINIVDQFGYKSAFYIFPSARAELQVIPKYVRVFAEAKGDVNRTSLHDLMAINPFLGQNFDIKNSVDQLDIAAGLKGTIAPGLGFKVTVFRNEIKNMPLFVNDFNLATGYNRFKVIYDEGRSRVSGLTGELDYKVSEDMDIFGRIEFKDYKMATTEPFFLPKVVFKGGTNFKIGDKISISGTLLVRGSVQSAPKVAPGGTSTLPTEIDGFADLSAGADYKLPKRFSVFIHANNLLNSTSQTWLYYPDYGFNIFGGVGYSF